VDCTCFPCFTSTTPEGAACQVEEGKQGFLVDWSNANDVQVAQFTCFTSRLYCC
jgi:hypothetical protein